MYRRGLVIGKFYPPHRGHSFLIDAALAQCETVTVMVCSRILDLIPAELRAHWLRQIHPAADVRVIDDNCLADDDSLGWAAYVKRYLGAAPDAVFTSEWYGEPFSRALGCAYVAVDADRMAVPISGTLIRRDPLDHLDYLAPCVRDYFTPRICVVGAESTGKSTLAETLAASLETEWVPEYGREYSEEQLARYGSMEEIVWTSHDFEVIARTQQQREQEAARRANRVLICDTDAFATAIWHERYTGARNPAVEEIARESRVWLYFLTDVRTPFVQDGLRDGQAIREWMDGRFREELTERRKRFVELAGDPEHRLAVARDIVIFLLRQPFDYRFASSLYGYGL